jgi:hypothetical protein
MKLLRTTALTAALMTAAVPMLTSPAHAWGWGWRGGGWGWGGAGLGLAVGALIGSALAAPYYGYGYGYPAYGYGYGYPAYGYGYGTGYGSGYGYAPTYGYGYGSGYGTGYVSGLRLRHRLRQPGLQLRLSPRCPTPYLCHHCWRPASLEVLSPAKPRTPGRAPTPADVLVAPVAKPWHWKPGLLSNRLEGTRLTSR